MTGCRAGIAVADGLCAEAAEARAGMPPLAAAHITRANWASLALFTPLPDDLNA
jgi:hypothetical protein